MPARRGRSVRVVARGCARRAIAEGHFRSDLDVEQFAYELQSLMLGYHHSARLMRDENAETRVFQSFESLLTKSKE